MIPTFGCRLQIFINLKCSQGVWLATLSLKNWIICIKIELEIWKFNTMCIDMFTTCVKNCVHTSFTDEVVHKQPRVTCPPSYVTCSILDYVTWDCLPAALNHGHAHFAVRNWWRAKRCLSHPLRTAKCVWPRTLIGYSLEAVSCNIIQDAAGHVMWGTRNPRLLVKTTSSVNEIWTRFFTQVVKHVDTHCVKISNFQLNFETIYSIFLKRGCGQPHPS